MAEYINRDAALGIVNGWREQLIPTYGKNDEYVKCLETVAEHLETLPAADVVERKPLSEDGAELVERLKIAAEWAGKGFCITPNLCLEAAVAIENLSKERNIGKWVKISPAGIRECSLCHHSILTSDIDVYKFCFACGAKMEE